MHCSARRVSPQMEEWLISKLQSNENWKDVEMSKKFFCSMEFRFFDDPACKLTLSKRKIFKLHNFSQNYVSEVHTK